MSLDLILFVDGDVIPAWQAESIARIVEEHGVRVRYIVRNPPRSFPSQLIRAIRGGGWGLLRGAQEVSRGVLTAYPPPLEPVGLDDCLWARGVRIESVEPEPTGSIGNELPGAVPLASDADFGVRFGYGFLVGDVLDAPEEGILSFHHGDLRAYRGRPAGFWEFVHGAGEAGITVQRLTDELDAGYVVAEDRVDIAGLPTWTDVLCRLLSRSPDLLSEAVGRVIGGEPHAKLHDEELGPLYRPPDARTLARYFLKRGPS